MNRKFVLITLLALVVTGILGLSNLGSQSMAASTTFERVASEEGTVNATELNLRQGPATNYKVVCVLKQGQEVKIIGKVDGWYAVYDPATKNIGAVSQEFIKLKEAPKADVKKENQKKVETKSPESTLKSVSTPTPAMTAKTGTHSPSKKTMVSLPEGISEDEKKVLELVNEARIEAGVEPLQIDESLEKIARLKVKDMVENDYFSHQSPTYASPFDMMRQFGVSFRTAGENIAGNQSIEGAFKAWMKSEGHKKNILNANFNYVGIGVMESPTYGKILVQQFIGK